MCPIRYSLRVYVYCTCVDRWQLGVRGVIFTRSLTAGSPSIYTYAPIMLYISLSVQVVYLGRTPIRFVRYTS
jgi:hypothetical protein